MLLVIWPVSRPDPQLSWELSTLLIKNVFNINTHLRDASFTKTFYCEVFTKGILISFQFGICIKNFFLLFIPIYLSSL